MDFLAKDSIDKQWPSFDILNLVKEDVFELTVDLVKDLKHVV